MTGSIFISDDWLITLSVVYGLGAVLSVWGSLFSPMILDWWDTPSGQKKKNQRDWATVFLVLLLLQVVTFTSSAVGMWFLGIFAYVPPAHLLLTFLAFLAIDFFRDDSNDPYKFSVLM